MTTRQISDPIRLDNYEIRHEIMEYDGLTVSVSTGMYNAYSLDGLYIGDPESADFLTRTGSRWVKLPIRWMPRQITNRIPDFDAPRILAWIKWHAWIHIPWRQSYPAITEFHLRTAGSSVCSMGFSESQQKWYGWSHRAVAGFGVGDKVKSGSTCTTATEGWALPVGFKAKTLEDARRMAAAHAESVS